MLSLLVLAEWFFTTVLISALVAGLYRLQQRNKTQVPQVVGYFISISDPQAEMQLSYAIELFNRGAYADAIEYSYIATENLLKAAYERLRLGPQEGSLDQLALRLKDYGLADLDLSCISYVVEAKKMKLEAATEDTAKKSIQSAREFMLYMHHAPLSIKLSG